MSRYTIPSIVATPVNIILPNHKGLPIPLHPLPLHVHTHARIHMKSHTHTHMHAQTCTRTHMMIEHVNIILVLFIHVNIHDVGHHISNTASVLPLLYMYSTVHELYIHLYYTQKHCLECIYKSVECPNEGCEVVLPSSELEDHTDVCQYRKVSCEHCGESLTVHSLNEHHTETCERYPTECERCQAKIERSKVHLPPSGVTCNCTSGKYQKVCNQVCTMDQ